MKTKRIISLVMTVSLLLALLPVFALHAGAATVDDVTAFRNKWNGKKISGDYGSQCVALFDEYIQSVFGVNWRPYAVGNAYELYNKDYSSLGWSKYPAGSYSYQVGDIVIWRAWGTKYNNNNNTAGHVAIVSSVSGGVRIFEQGASYNAREVAIFYTDSIIGIIRPVFSAEGAEMSKGYDRAIPDGDYLIVSFKDPQYQLDIIGNDIPAANNANVNLWPVGDALRVQDVFTVRYDPSDQFYSILQKGTNMSLDVAEASRNCGANVQMYPSNGTAAQKWAITDAWVDGRWIGYRIQAKCSGFSVDISGGACQQGTNLQMWTNNDSQAQSWLFIPYQPAQPVAAGRYMLISGISDNIELDVLGNTGEIEDGTNVGIWNTSTDNRYNSFDLVPLENGYYTLVHAASGKALDVSEGSRELAANVQTWGRNNSAAQQWAITELNDGYMLRAGCSGMALDIEDGKTADGTNVRQCRYNGSNAQTWKLVKAEYSVKYHANGGTGAPKAQTKYYQNALTLRSERPSREGFTFLGWSTSYTGTKAAYQPGGVYEQDADLNLYAIWKSDGTGQPQAPFCFDDVRNEAQFYFDPVYWAYEHEPQITTGTDATHFSPARTCTRAQVVTFLWRAKGCPEPTLTFNPFADVKPDAYYYKAVLWALQNSITNGVDSTHFGPDRGCTRGQVVTFQWRSAGMPEPASGTNPFIDVKSDAYYHKAVLWAVEQGITKGTSADKFSPDSTCTRGQIVTFLYRDLAE